MSGATFDTVLVRWSGGETRCGFRAAENNLEGFVEEASLTTEAQAFAYGGIWLTEHGATVDQVSVGIQPQRTETTPFISGGLGKGDALKVQGRDGVGATNRIYSVGFTGLRRNGQPNYAVTLGTRRQEREVAVQRQLGKIGGTMGGSFLAATPSVAPSFGDVPNSPLPSISLPLADADTFTTESPYDRTAPVRFTDPTAIIRFQCQAESLVGTDNTLFSLYRITYVGGTPTETPVETFTWDGTRRLAQFFCEHTFQPDQAYQLRIVTAGAHNLASIQPVGSSIN